MHSTERRTEVMTGTLAHKCQWWIPADSVTLRLQFSFPGGETFSLVSVNIVPVSRNRYGGQCSTPGSTTKSCVTFARSFQHAECWNPLCERERCLPQKIRRWWDNRDVSASEGSFTYTLYNLSKCCFRLSCLELCSPHCKRARRIQLPPQATQILREGLC